jgi:hypothetical protein
VSLSEKVGLLCSFRELYAQELLAVRPFPILANAIRQYGLGLLLPPQANLLIGVMGYFLFTWRRLSPDKIVDLLRALAQFAAMPFYDFFAQLVQAKDLYRGCVQSHGFVWGLLQASPCGALLPLAIGQCHQPRKGHAPLGHHPCWVYPNKKTSL